MAAVFKDLGALGPLLLLLAALQACARADDVTTTWCKARGSTTRARRYPVDSNATLLHMNSCGLHRVNSLDFAGLPSLEIVDLNFNEIESITPAALHTAPTLRTLWLSAKKMSELPVFAEHSCPNLYRLNLSHNLLTGIYNATTFLACAKLSWLALNVNHIRYIHPDVFSPLTGLTYLHLESNQISFIPDQMFTRNGKLKHLYLSSNRISYLPPYFASSLRHAGARLEKIIFHDNPWQCACLLELLADVQRAGVMKYKRAWGETNHHYEGTLPECVYIGMHPCYRPARPTVLGPARETGDSVVV